MSRVVGTVIRSVSPESPLCRAWCAVCAFVSTLVCSEFDLKKRMYHTLRICRGILQAVHRSAENNRKKRRKGSEYERIPRLSSTAKVDDSLQSAGLAAGPPERGSFYSPRAAIQPLSLSLSPRAAETMPI
jgi:hypothetical protein